VFNTVITYVSSTGGDLPQEQSGVLSDSDMEGGGGGGGGGGSTSALVEVSSSGGVPSGKFLRSFCRYCNSHPFYCGEMLHLCYSNARVYV